MHPLNLSQTLGHNNFIFLLIGVGFGLFLEMSGFGDSTILSAQFYFKEMRVLKVMFTAIITAMILIFFSTSIGLIDFSKIFVNPTYLWTGIIGGLVMGVGFIIGGFCPGTSLVGAVTLKLDAILFLLGVFFGVFLFGESVPLFEIFWNSSSYGRLTLDEIFHISIGAVVLLVFIFALIAFYLSEWAEKKMGYEFIATVKDKKIILSSIILACLMIGSTIVIGQPTAERKWKWIAKLEQPKIDNREVYIHPGELRELMLNQDIQVSIIDLRTEEEFNLFNLENSKLLTPAIVTGPLFIKDLNNLPPNNVTVLISTSDIMATEVWKKLRANDVINLYILDKGINNWLQVFPLEEKYAKRRNHIRSGDQLNFEFFQAVGNTQFSSFPFNPLHENENVVVKFDKKVKLQTKSAVKGGCG